MSGAKSHQQSGAMSGEAKSHQQNGAMKVVEQSDRRLLDWAVASRPHAGEEISGDQHLVQPFDGGVLVAVVDALGHGRGAATVAASAVAELRRRAGAPLDVLLDACHRRLGRSRGAVLALADFREQSAVMSWAAIGNVDGVLVRADGRREALFQEAGVIGVRFARPRPHSLPVQTGDTLVLASDGIRPGWLAAVSASAEPATIAERILREHGRPQEDDALVLVARWRPSGPGTRGDGHERSELATRYAEALEQHLARGDEATLAVGHELGRSALETPRGLLELATAHHAALRARLAVTPDELARAGDFLAESLAVFEMAQRGYREANEKLRELNESLEARNAELQRAKATAETATRELEAFSYSVSHDLRAPLRSIDGFVQALLEEHAGELNEEGRRYLDVIHRATERMARLIEALLLLARVAQAPLRAEQVSLSQLVRAAEARLRSDNPERQVDLWVQDDVIAEGDPRLLAIVVDNLLGNAWKFTSRRPVAHVAFGVQPSPAEPIYFVRDDGAGFDQAYAGKLFAPFQRLHAEQEYAGAGIGLATVQRIIRRHGGRVWAEGAVDRGATFYFTLPQAQSST